MRCCLFTRNQREDEAGRYCNECGNSLNPDKGVCECEMPYWTVEDMFNCADCGKPLPEAIDG